MGTPTSSSRSPASYRPDIDGLRGLAVLGVVLYHLGATAVQGGFVGVDVFLVISGFLITRLIREDLEASRFSFARFYARRARRILPALLVTIAGSLGFGFLLLPPEQYARLARSSMAAALALSNLFFFRESGYFDVGSQYKPLLHTWSLGVEEQFYFVWPLALFLAIRVGAQWLPLAVAVLALASLAASEALLDAHPSAAFFLTPFRAFEFGFGALLVWMPRAGALSRAAAETLWWVGLGLVLVSMSQLDEATPFPGARALAPCAGAALLIYVGESARSAALLRSWPAVGLGKISYSLYLVHWPLIVFYRYWNFGELDRAQSTMAFCASGLLAALLFRCVETPLRERGGGSVRPRAVALAFGAVIALLLVGASLIERQGGWAWRVDPSLATVTVDQGDDRRRILEACRPAAASLGRDLCAFGFATEGPYDYVLVGDSHAEHFILGLHALFLERRQSALFLPTHPDNVPLKGGVLRTSGRPGKTNQNEYDLLESLAYRNVIFAARWHLYANTTSHDLKAARIYTFGKHTELTAASSLAALGAATRHTVAYLRERGKGVTILGQVPPFGPDANLCLNRPRYLIFNERSACGGLDKGKIAELAHRSDALFEGLARELEFDFINLTDVVCPDACSSVIDGSYIYRDDDHVNRFGSVALARRGLWSHFPADAEGEDKSR